MRSGTFKCTFQDCEAHVANSFYKSKELRKTKQLQSGEQNTNKIRHNYGGRSRSRWLYGANNMEYYGDFKNHGPHCVGYFHFVYFRKKLRRHFASTTISV